MAFDHSAKHMHMELAGLLHAQPSNGAGGDAQQPADNGAVDIRVDAEQHVKPSEA